MTQAKKGDTVRVHYTGKLGDGTVFDTSADRDPIQFTVGASEVIPGFEKAVIGMSPGEKKTAELPADDAYGPRRDDRVAEIGREQLPDDLDPAEGQELQLRQPNGEAIRVRVTHVSEESITLDANHPLAGEDLTFEIELVEIP